MTHMCNSTHLRPKNFNDYAKFETFHKVVDKFDDEINEFLSRLK